MEHTPETIYKNRMLILANVVLLAFMATLDGSIVNVALPTMSADLKISSESVAWVVTVYLLAIVGSILLFGRLGDIIGKINVFLLGVGIFTVGSLLCGLSPSFTTLIAARVLQAVGASASMATNQGIITEVFPKNERGKALGISATSVALGALAGPPLGGFILHYLSWKYIFLINIPIGVGVFLAGLFILPREKRFVKEPFDIKGGLLFAVSPAALFLSLSLGKNEGFDSPLILSGFALFLITFILFLLLESKTSVPLIRLNLFKNSLFSLSIFCSFLSFAAMSGPTIILPFYLQKTMGYSPAVTGLLMMVSPIVLAVVAPVSGTLSDKIGSELLTFVGLTIAGAGLLSASFLTEHSSLLQLILCVAVLSLGNGLFQSPNNSLTMSNAPSAMLGIAGSVNALVRNIGMIIGITLAVLLLYGRMSRMLGVNVSDYVDGRDDVFIYGMRGACYFAAGVCALGALLTALRLLRRKKAGGGLSHVISV